MVWALLGADCARRWARRASTALSRRSAIASKRRSGKVQGAGADIGRQVAGLKLVMGMSFSTLRLGAAMDSWAVFAVSEPVKLTAQLVALLLALGAALRLMRAGTPEMRCGDQGVAGLEGGGRDLHQTSPGHGVPIHGAERGRKSAAAESGGQKHKGPGQ